MTSMSGNDLRAWVGRTAIGPDGGKIGKIGEVYVDDATGQPTWLAVSTGMFGTRVSFVPLAGARPAGDDVMVAYDKATVKDAPNAEVDGHLSREEEAALYRHYGYEDTAPTGGGVKGRAPKETSAQGADDAMTRSEEELQIDKRTREAGRARLRKWVETENVQVTVPVAREKAQLVTEPITDANVDRAMSGPEISDAEHQVVLSEEEVDVTKRVVPKERVRLETETVTEDVPVDEAVRKERIAYEGDDTTKPPR
jgi:uncharacterized protein (TIGR02271 family)